MSSELDGQEISNATRPSIEPTANPAKTIQNFYKIQVVIAIQNQQEDLESI